MDIEGLLKDFLSKSNTESIELDETLVEEFGEACKDAVRTQFSAVRGEYTLRPSSIGKDVCKQQHDKLGSPKAELGYNFPVKMLLGCLIEALTVLIMKSSGINIEEEQKKVSETIEGEEIGGTLDVVIDGRVWDIKSASPASFIKYKKGYESLAQDDPFGYVGQLFSYARARGLPAGGWIAVEKSTGEICITEIPEEDCFIGSEALYKAKECVKVLRDTHTVKDIKRQYDLETEMYGKKPTGSLVLGKACIRCDYKDTCWNNPVLRPNPKSPSKNPRKYWEVTL